MQQAVFIGGDWGTSSLRLFLCARDGTVLDSKTGPGISSVRGNVGPALFDLVAPWDALHGALPLVMCGMVGSSIGWREVPYLQCPVRLDSIAGAMMRFEAGGRKVAIAPGMSCRNNLQAPDMMRGEETQIFGALQMHPDLAEGHHFICLPGTHTKWVAITNGVVEHFLTALTGELFDLLYRHSVLINAEDAPEAMGGPQFLRALDQARMFPEAELIHLLFETRSRQLAGGLKKRDAAAYLSGLIIGQDVSGVKRFFRHDLEKTKRVMVIGNDRLTELYVTALETRNMKAVKIDGAVAACAGLRLLYESLCNRDANLQPSQPAARK